MSNQASTETYCPVTVMRPSWYVTDVMVAGLHMLTVTFLDGTRGNVRFEPGYFSGIFEPLSEPEVFKKVHIDEGAVAWPGDIDIAPDAMYDEIHENGEWVLR